MPEIAADSLPALAEVSPPRPPRPTRPRPSLREQVQELSDQLEKIREKLERVNDRSWDAVTKAELNENERERLRDRLRRVLSRLHGGPHWHRSLEERVAELEEEIA